MPLLLLALSLISTPALAEPELQAGSSARLGFLPFCAGQVQILELSLQGFTAASRDI